MKMFLVMFEWDTAHFWKAVWRAVIRVRLSLPAKFATGKMDVYREVSAGTMRMEDLVMTCWV